MSPPWTYISGAVEGITDEAVLARVVRAAGAEPFRTYSKRGKAALKQGLASYNNAARFAPWVVLLDLDTDADCVANARRPATATACPADAPADCRQANRRVDSGGRGAWRGFWVCAGVMFRRILNACKTRKMHS
jgi:hypothetical protein